MTEGRISQVVGQAGSTNDAAKFREMGLAQLWMALKQQARDIVAQRTPHAGNLQAMGQAIVDEDAARKGKHLRLVLQTPEGSGEDQAVVVALKFRAVVALLPAAFKAQTFAAQ